MTEEDYILSTDLTKVRIAYNILSDCMFVIERKKQLSIIQELHQIRTMLESEIDEKTTSMDNGSSSDESISS